MQQNIGLEIWKQQKSLRISCAHSLLNKGWNVTTKYRHSLRNHLKLRLQSKTCKQMKKTQQQPKKVRTGNYTWFFAPRLLIATNLMSWIAHLGFESQGQSKLGGLVNSLGIYLTGNSEKRLWPPLVLNEGTYLAKVVNSCLHCGERVQWVLSASSNGILICWEAVRYLSPNSCGSQRPHRMIVRCDQSLTLVVPKWNNIAQDIMDRRNM